MIDKAVLSENLPDGRFLETNQEPIIVTNSILCGDHTGAGILITKSMNITLEKSIIHGNGQSQVNGFADTMLQITNWEMGRRVLLTPENWTLRNNAIVGGNASQLVVLLRLASSLWPRFVNSLTSNNNVWFNPGKTTVFNTQGTPSDLPGWRTTTGQDANSLFTDPRFVDPANCNFTLLPGNPLLSMQL